MMIALATRKHWMIHQLDVKYAFLNGELKEEVYLQKLEGFVQKGKEHLVCRLKKALHGLKQAPRSWYEKIDSFFLQQSYNRSKSGPNLYTVKDEKRCIVLISLYVDDLIVISDFFDLIKEIKKQISQAFEMKDLGEVRYYLGLDIWRD